MTIQHVPLNQPSEIIGERNYDIRLKFLATDERDAFLTKLVAERNAAIQAEQIAASKRRHPSSQKATGR